MIPEFLDAWPESYYFAFLGCCVGVALGFTARTVRFCSLSAIESALYGRDFQLLRLWALAMAVAICVTQGLSLYGGLEIAQSAYVTTGSIPLLSLVVGGVVFGLGMALVGTCSLGSILRFGGGDLRGLVTLLLIGVSGYMTMKGLFQPVNKWLHDHLNIDIGQGVSSDVPSLIGQLFTPESQDMVTLILTITFAVSLTFWSFSAPRFRASFPRQIGGMIVGILVGFGWYVTGVLGQEGFSDLRPSSLSFVAPAGETVTYLMNYTGLSINFAIGSVFGAILGAFIASLKQDDFHWDSFDDPREMKRQMTGACLMGFGAVVASGCTIGQGVTGISTLSVNSLIALLGIIGGASIGLKLLIDGSLDRIAFFR